MRVSYNKQLAGMWVQCGDNIAAAIKVKLHFSKEQSAARGEGHLHRGNQMVDSIVERARPA